MDPTHQLIWEGPPALQCETPERHMPLTVLWGMQAKKCVCVCVNTGGECTCVHVCVLACVHGSRLCVCACGDVCMYDDLQNLL